MSLVLWVVFVSAFRAELPGRTQFAPYLVSGVLTITFFSQGVMQAAESITNSRNILNKVFLPPSVLIVSSSIGSTINFIFGLLGLGILSVAVGHGISLLFPLVVLFILSMFLFVSGFAMLLSILFIRYSDTRNIFNILLVLIVYLTPVFYPKKILSGVARQIVELNPLTSYLDIFRFVFLAGEKVSEIGWIYMIACGPICYAVGYSLFHRYWPRTAAML
jgi:ABC-type polysaccharide/polyol phosphate export permease